MISALLILCGYTAGVLLCLWLQAVHYKLKGMVFGRFNILYAFIPFSFAGPLFAIGAYVLDGKLGIAAKIQRVLTLK